MATLSSNTRAKNKQPCPALDRYAANIVFNVLNKTCLNAFPCPWFMSTMQLGGWPAG